MKPKYFLFAIVLLAVVALAPNSFAQAGGEISFATLKDLIDVLPHPLVQELKTSTKIESARERANDLFREKAVGKTATMTLRASDWHEEIGVDKLPRFKIAAQGPPINVLGTSFTVRMWVWVPKDQGGPLAKIAKGGQITATGKLSRFVLSPERGKLLLDGDLSDATLEANKSGAQ